ncbi:MAG: hypothetical protein RI953_3009 [Pseudomonadota bacterium]|jgi:hypothetical protein
MPVINFKKSCVKLGLAALLGFSLLQTQKAHAGQWGMLLGINNPAGSNLGLNFLYQSAGSLGFEVGVGGLYGKNNDNGTDVSTWGDFDVKWFPGAGPWRGFLEGGMAFGLGTGSSGSGLAAGSPFVGGGLLYSGTTMLFHVTGDYEINSRTAYPALGIGFKL